MKSTSHPGHDRRRNRSRLEAALVTAATVATMACALLSACGGGGPDDETATAPVGAVPPGATTESFVVVPARAKLGIGATTRLRAVATKSAVQWSSSDPAVATVEADGTVHALIKGNAVITATTGNDSASSAVSIYQTDGASPDPTSEALIGKALASGTIDAEQALVYRVFAQLGDARLPAAYDGGPNAAPDHMILREAASRMAKLSAANRAILQPFFIPPIYPQSWYAQQIAANVAPLAAGRVFAQSARRSTLSARTDNCQAAASPDYWRRLSTKNFNIHYVAIGSAAFADIDAEDKALAESIAAVIEEVYGAETALLGRFAKADTDQPCNGGDGATDIYLGSLEPRTLAQTIPYGGTCADTSSFIVVNSNYEAIRGLGILATRSRAEGEGLIKSLLAHEVMHVLQLAMSRGQSCTDLKWFDEATAEWAMDFVVPTIAQGSAGSPGLEDGTTKVAHLMFGKTRSGAFLAEYLFTGHMRSLEDGVPRAYGYADYLFFQYLHRKHGNSAIKGIFDGMAGGAGDLEAIAAAVDMKTVWPAFALTLWNDAAGKVLDYWSTEDKYDFGLWDVFAHSDYLDGAPKNLKSLEIDQKGQPRATFALLDNALPNSKSGDYEIAPRSLIYEHLKFTDPTVRSVYLLNPVGANPSAEFMKVQVVMKIDGEWKPPEDWTKASTKQFCRDKKSERLEEMLIVVSNSEVDRFNEKPFRIPKLLPMRISTSNVGCWKWQGSASTVDTLTTPFPGDDIVTAAGLTFEVASVLPGRLIFLTTGGTISANARISISLCNVTLDATPRVAAQLPAPDGTIDINLDLDLGFGGLGAVDPPDRKFLALSGASSLATLTREVCPTGVRTASGSQVWSWLGLDDLSSYQVSADGQTIEGRVTTVAFGTTTTTTWKFSAVRE